MASPANSSASPSYCTEISDTHPTTHATRGFSFRFGYFRELRTVSKIISSPGVTANPIRAASGRPALVAVASTPSLSPFMNRNTSSMFIFFSRTISPAGLACYTRHFPGDSLLTSFTTRFFRRARKLFFPLAALLAFCNSVHTCAQEISADQMKGLSWRLVGPFRGGRVTAVAGIAGDPKTYYMGTPGGGVWKTTNGGATWDPIFDDAHVASIGDLVVAPSDSKIIYVATGEQTPGNGLWKSTDSGATWANIGL